MSRLLDLAQHCYTMMQDNSLSDNDKEDYRNMLKETKSYLDNLVMIRDDYKQQKSSESKPKEVKKEPQLQQNKPVEIKPERKQIKRATRKPVNRKSSKRTEKVKANK
tara:strand:+ start:260 stop:580 length:321 start_codon:yes stop_codon:yes gene_type:complete